MWKRMFGKRDIEQGAQVDSQAQSPGPSAYASTRGQTPTVTFRPMTQVEYQQLRSWLDEDYAREVAKAMGVSIEEGRAAAEKQLAELLKDGLQTEGHYLWKIVAEDGTAVGDLWVLVEPSKERAFIYFIGIDEAYRGKGYSRAAMQALETTVKPMGASRIDLSVFGDNATAINLYQSLGYQVLGMGMRKPI
jgi:ribosomal protein S18 acetylase RimI-like enzyme